MRKFALVLAIVFVVLLWAGIAFADCKSNEGFKLYGLETSLSRVDKCEEVSVTGMLVRRVAIGGETTGWAVELDLPLVIRGKTLNLVEIDLDSMKINAAPFENERVKVEGKLVKRYGVERGAYWVIVVKRFS